jgi:hypothetical protein
MNCRVCGRQFDPLGYQVMVPGLPHGFDRVDCALEASALDLPEARRIEPVPAVVRTLPAAATLVPALATGLPPAARAESVRPQLFAGANLALLAAGTLATIYLWLRVFGADAGPFSFAASASEAFSRSSIAAAIDLTPETGVQPEPESTVDVVSTPPVTAPTGPSVSADDGGTLASNTKPKDKPRARRNGVPAARPAPTPPPSEPPSEPAPARSAPTPTFPVPSSPPDDRVPGPSLPSGPAPEQPSPPGGGRP